LLYYEILPGSGNADGFTHYIDNLARAKDTARFPGDSIIIMDNVAFHKHRDSIETIEVRGFLPSYSPILNPIECHFSQWKSYVTKGQPTCDDDLIHSINTVDDHVTAEH